jgi:hypothetical protein
MKNLLFFCLLLTGPLAAASSITVPGSLTHESTVKPKQVVQKSIPIQNNGDTKATVKVTLSDYFFNAQGENSFPEAGSSARSNSSWIKTGETQIEIAPHSTYNFSYTVKTPDDPSLEGSYWSIFLIEPTEISMEGLEEDQSLGVHTVIRYGVQVISHIENKGNYDLKILDKKITKDNEQTTFSISTYNSGTCMQSPELAIELIDSLGKKAGRFTASKQRIFPSCSVTYQVDLSSVPKGDYKVVALLDHGENAFFGAKYDIKLD